MLEATTVLLQAGFRPSRTVYFSFGHDEELGGQRGAGSVVSAITFGNAILRTTTAPTMLSGSVKTNILPVEAIVTVNFRIHPSDTVEDVVNHVRAAVESEHIEVRVPPGSGRPGSRVSDWESDGFEIIDRSVRQIYGDVGVAPGLMIAGSDSRHSGKMADNSFRFNPMVLSQDDLPGFHGTNHSIGVANLGKGVRTYLQILRNAASN
ncbi:MAG: carboxypeptidase PM20D1 [Rhodothermales bacterium]|jgi:carboxypeptidase PM20D1